MTQENLQSSIINQTSSIEAAVAKKQCTLKFLFISFRVFYYFYTLQLPNKIINYAEKIYHRHQSRIVVFYHIQNRSINAKYFEMTEIEVLIGANKINKYHYEDI